MRLLDQFGYELTAKNMECVSAWNATITAFLAHAKDTPLHLEKALEHDPDFALGHSARGLFCMLLGRRELVAAAKECLSIAKASIRERGASEREQAVTRALSAWLDGWPSQAAETLDDALQKFPRDALLLKLVHAIRFVLGDATGMRTSIDTVIGEYDRLHPSYGYVLGCRAFALEETGDFKAAEALGREGLEYAPDDAWGLHAVAHVHDMTGRSVDGIKWLESQPNGWAHCNNFGYHVWWHLALMYLDRGDATRALALYDEEIRRDRTDDYRDISNGVSLLIRLELEGISVGNRWEEMAQISDKRAEDGCNVFADLHYLLALLNGGRRFGAERLLNTLRTTSKTEGDLARISSSAGEVAALGLEQFRLGNYGSAFMHLKNARSNLKSIGGSHAQRDVFERLTIDAGIRAGLAKDAHSLLEDRLKLRGGLDHYAEQRFELCEKMLRAERIMGDQRLRATSA